jgi:predicted phosphodiesterase
MNLKHFNIYNLSDSIAGILRMSQLQSLQLGIVDATIGFADFLAAWLNKLSEYITIDYYAVNGNHNEIRPLGSKKGDFPHENTERIISWYLSNILKNNPNIIVHENHLPINYTNILGVDILAVHGQDEKNLENSIKDYSNMYGENIDILLTGHLHNNFEKTINIGKNGNIEIIQSPSIIGIDDYSTSLKKSSRAGSKFFIIEEGIGRTWTKNIHLN